MNVRFRFLAPLVLLAAATLPASAYGLSLHVVEKESLMSPSYKKRYVVDDALGTDDQGHPDFNLQPEANAEHKALIDLLAPGVSFDDPKVRKEVAGILYTLPPQCREHSELVLKVNPIGDITAWLPDVKDKRRITILAVNQCLAETPPECRYCLCQDGGFNFTLGDLKQVLQGCASAVNEAVKKGAAFADWRKPARHSSSREEE